MKPFNLDSCVKKKTNISKQKKGREEIREKMQKWTKRPTWRCSQFQTETWSDASAVTSHGCVGCNWILMILSLVGRNALKRSIFFPFSFNSDIELYWRIRKTLESSNAVRSDSDQQLTMELQFAIRVWYKRVHFQTSTRQIGQTENPFSPRKKKKKIIFLFFIKKNCMISPCNHSFWY